MFSTFKFSGLPKGDPPSAPTSVVLNRSGLNTVNFAWNVSASNGNRPITGYIVNLDGVGTQSVGFPGLGGPYGRTYGYDWNVGNCPSCNYTGSVQAVNSIGASSAAGATYCAPYGNAYSGNNCSGTTKYDLYTDGNCGYYWANIQYDSPYCGYTSPCAGSSSYGTYAGAYCSSCAGGAGCDRSYVYSDGCHGSYIDCVAGDCCAPS